MAAADAGLDDIAAETSRKDFDDLNDLARTAIETEFRRAWPLSVILSALLVGT